MSPGGGAASPGQEARHLRICADPNNLPFSNARGEGLENALARLVARDLGAILDYTWMPQRRGFVKNTLQAGKCDVIVEVPVGFERASTTDALYRSSYVFVFRKDRALGLRSLDDPRLKELRIGVQTIGDDYANSPPVAALAARGLVDRVVGYSVYGDYAGPVPLSPIVADVARGRIDAALVWGPTAGWLAKRARVPLMVVPVSPGRDAGFPIAFDIAMGVRRGDAGLRAELNDVIQRRRHEIQSILRRYGVPLVGETGAP